MGNDIAYTVSCYEFLASYISSFIDLISFQVVSVRSRWFQFVPVRSRWFRMVPGSSSLFHVVPALENLHKKHHNDVIIVLVSLFLTFNRFYNCSGAFWRLWLILFLDFNILHILRDNRFLNAFPLMFDKFLVCSSQRSLFLLSGLNQKQQQDTLYWIRQFENGMLLE